VEDASRDCLEQPGMLETWSIGNNARRHWHLPRSLTPSDQLSHDNIMSDHQLTLWLGVRE